MSSHTRVQGGGNRKWQREREDRVQLGIEWWWSGGRGLAHVKTFRCGHQSEENVYMAMVSGREPMLSQPLGVRQSPASSAQRRKIWKYVPSLSSLLVWFSPGRELLGYFTVYLSSLSFVVCFAGLLWPLVVHRHTQTRPWPEGDVNKLIWLICWFWKNFNSFD